MGLFDLKGWRRDALYVALAAIVTGAAGYVAGVLGWHKVWDAINSGIAVGVAGAALSSYAGAYAAQRIVERKNVREEILKEIKNVNMTIQITLSIFNGFVTLKKQQIIGMKETYDHHRAEFFEHRRKFKAHQLQSGEVFTFQSDYRTLQIPVFASEMLKSQMTEKVFVIGRSFFLTMVLAETVDGLNKSIALRNQLIETMRAKDNDLTEDYKIEKYFGTKNRLGHIDQNYPDSVEAIWVQTNNGIVFSMLIAQDLIAHGETLKTKFDREFRGEAPKILKADFAEVEKLGLIPDLKDFAQWVNMAPKPLDNTARAGD
jgi:hypothetical protein